MSRFLLKREFYINEGSQEIKKEGINAVVYVGPGLVAKCFRGRANKPTFYYRFPTQERMDKFIEGFFQTVENTQKIKQERRNAKKEIKTSLKLGDILYASWGYEQTNIDFYEVVEVLESGKSVRIREVDQNRQETLFMQGNCSPIPGNYIGEAMLKRVNSGDSVSINSYSSAYKWDGSPMSFSTYG